MNAGPFADEQITFPVAGCAIGYPGGRPGLSSAPCPGSGRGHPHARRAARRAAAAEGRGRSCPAQLAARLHEQRPIDRLVTDPHLPDRIGLPKPQSGQSSFSSGHQRRSKPRLDGHQQPRRHRGARPARGRPRPPPPLGPPTPRTPDDRPTWLVILRPTVERWRPNTPASPSRCRSHRPRSRETDPLTLLSKWSGS